MEAGFQKEIGFLLIASRWNSYCTHGSVRCFLCYCCGQYAGAWTQRVQSARTVTIAFSSMELVFPSKNALPLGTKTSKPAKSRTAVTGSTKSPNDSLRCLVRPLLFRPLDPCILPVRSSAVQRSLIQLYTGPLSSQNTACKLAPQLCLQYWALQYYAIRLAASG